VIVFGFAISFVDFKINWYVGLVIAPKQCDKVYAFDYAVVFSAPVIGY